MKINNNAEIVVVMVFVVLLSGCQENSKGYSSEKHYYPTGELEHEIFLKDSLLHGLSTTYYKNGKIKYERCFFEDVPIDHHYYYSEEGELLVYKFYDVRGNLRYQLLSDTTTAEGYSQDGKSLYIQGDFKANYSIGDSVSLIPIVANPFKKRYSVIFLTEKEKIKKSYAFTDSISPLFLYTIKRGSNPIKVIGEVNDNKGRLFKRDTVLLDLKGLVVD
jgi:hypothetical protein